jgi:reactive intermediate/imine deaminase
MTDRMFHMFAGAAKPVAPYSHAVSIDGWLFLTGQIPNIPGDDAQPLPRGIAAQTRRVMDNLIIVLTEAGYGLGDVVSARVFLTDFARDYAEMNAIYQGCFTPERLPARTCIGVTALAREALIEIDMIAKR